MNEGPYYKIVRRTEHSACSRMGAPARVGLSPGGREAGRAWCQEGLPPDWVAFLGAGVFGSSGSSPLLLGRKLQPNNYRSHHRVTERVQRLLAEVLRLSGLTIIVDLGLASPGRPPTASHPCICSTACAPVVCCLWAGADQTASSSSGWAPMQAPHGRACTRGLATSSRPVVRMAARTAPISLQPHNC